MILNKKWQTHEGFVKSVFTHTVFYKKKDIYNLYKLTYLNNADLQMDLVYSEFVEVRKHSREVPSQGQWQDIDQYQGCKGVKKNHCVFQKWQRWRGKKEEDD